jgi:hypothetical protein
VEELVDESDRLRARSALRRLREDPGPRPAFEISVRHADGPIVHLEAVGNNLLNAPRSAGSC